MSWGKKGHRDAREEDVRRCLAKYGLAVARTSSERQRGRSWSPETQLLRALRDLGPVFSSFGGYVACRPDLAPERTRDVFSSLKEWFPPMCAKRLRRLIDSELGVVSDSLLAHMERQPSRSGLLYQEHRASPTSQTPVVVRIVRKSATGRQNLDMDLLRMLMPALQACQLNEEAIDCAVADFRERQSLGVDLRAQARMTGALGQGTSVARPELVPRVLPRFSGARVLTTTCPGGDDGEVSFATKLASAWQNRSATSDSRPLFKYQAESLAEGIAGAWLKQTLELGLLPVDLEQDSVLPRVDGRVVLRCGLTVQLESRTRRNLWSYLMAAAAQEPDLACDFLLRELAGKPSNDEAIRKSFRQVVSHRETPRGVYDDLAGQLFLHWRLAAEGGYRPPSHMKLFFESLYRLVRQLRELVPHKDVLFTALRARNIEEQLIGLMASLSPTRLGRVAFEGLSNQGCLAGSPEERSDCYASGNGNDGAGEQRKAHIRTKSRMVHSSILLGLALFLLSLQLVWPEVRWVQGLTIAAIIVIAMEMKRMGRA